MNTYNAAIPLAGLVLSLACSPAATRVTPAVPILGDTLKVPNEDPQGQKREANLRPAILAEDTTVRPLKDAELAPAASVAREDSSIRVKGEQYIGVPRNEAPVKTGKREDFVPPRVAEQNQTQDSIDRELQRGQDTTRDAGRILRPNLTRNDQELRGRVILQGPLRRSAPGRWVLEETKQPRTRLGFLIAVSDSAFARATSRDSIATAVANRLMYPTGAIEGIAVRQGSRVAYIAEEVRDRAWLSDADRFGFRISQVVTPLGAPAFRSSSRSTYDVPVRVTNGQISATLQPGQSDTLSVGGTRYAIRIDFSRYTVPQGGEVTFEEPRHHFKYVILALP